MTYNDVFKLDLPKTFPADDYELFMTAARDVLLPDKGPPWQEFAGASNLIGWRFRSTREYLDAYLKTGDASHDEVYIRERALFGMFTNGVSCIESTCYALYALASHPSVLGITFGDDERRKATPAKLKAALESHEASESSRSLSRALEEMTGSDEWREWRDLRSRMMHRSNLPRLIQGTTGSAPPPGRQRRYAATSSTPALDGDPAHLESLLDWLAGALSLLLRGGSELAAPT